MGILHEGLKGGGWAGGPTNTPPEPERSEGILGENISPEIIAWEQARGIPLYQATKNFARWVNTYRAPCAFREEVKSGDLVTAQGFSPVTRIGWRDYEIITAQEGWLEFKEEAAEQGWLPENGFKKFKPMGAPPAVGTPTTALELALIKAGLA